MGRRGGKRSRTFLSQEVIEDQIERLKLGDYSVEDIANHLHSVFPEYKRFKLIPFRTKIREFLEQNSTRKKRRIDCSRSSSVSATTYSDEVDMVKTMLRAGYKQHSPPTKGGGDEKEKEKEVAEEFRAKEEGLRFKDFGGIKEKLDLLELEVFLPLRYPDLLDTLNLPFRINPISGILLTGPPGCGKTTLANAIANESGFSFYKISAPQLVSGVSGESEANIRELFSKAHKTAPSIVFIDEIDAIASKRENLHKGMEHRIVTQLLTCMDESHNGNGNGNVIVIGATNMPDALDPALRRCGRFDMEIPMTIPDAKARAEILSRFTFNASLDADVDVTLLARDTSGFVGADLQCFVRSAAIRALDRHLHQLHQSPQLRLSMLDFQVAAKTMQPSLMREGFSAIPNVTWEDVGGLSELRKELERHIVWSIQFPELNEQLGLGSGTGYLLYGPPGCGKTLIAKAVAREAGANFIHVKGPELLNKYVGESESHIRKLFHRARTCSPCILFFDEVDALTTERGKEVGSVVDRLLTQLLIELDGGEDRHGVYVIGATNRPEVVDKALLRPGRFGKSFYVPLPKPDERGLVLEALARRNSLNVSLSLMDLGRSEMCDNFSGADLDGLMKEAASVVQEEMISAFKEGKGGLTDTDATIEHAHFEIARTRVSPSVSKAQIQHYNRLAKSFGAR